MTGTVTSVPVIGGRCALMVLGMHRSGTSAMAGVLSLLGASLPKVVMPATPGINDVGFFEPSRIVEIHDELLADAGSFWHDTSPLPDAWFRSPAARAFGRRLRSTYEEEYGDAPLTVLKDPRVCRLLPLWREVLASLDVTPRFVNLFRHPAEVAASLARRDGLPPGKSHLLWLQHVLLAEYESRGHARAFVAYEEMLTDPHTVLARLGEDLGIEWPSPVPQVSSQIAEFLARRHRHNRTFSPDQPAPEDLTGPIAAAYSILESLDKVPSPAQEKALDRIRRSYLDSDQLQGPLARSLQLDLIRHAEGFETHRAELARWIADRDARILGLETEVRAQHALARESEKQLQDSRAVLVERDAQIEARGQLAIERDRQLHDTLAVVAARDLEIHNLHQAVAERDQQIEHLHQAVAERDQQIEHLHQEVAERDQRIERLHHGVAERDQQAQHLQQALAEREDALRGAQSTLAEHDRALVAANDRVNARSSEVEALGGRVQELKVQLEAGQTEISELRASWFWRITSPLRALTQLGGRSTR